MRTRSRTVVILIFDDCDLLDVALPVQVLSQAGRKWNFRPFKLLLAGPKAGATKTQNQVVLDAGESIENCPWPEHLLVPGGYGIRRLLESPRVIDWLSLAAAKASTVSGIGYGTLLLAKAGILDGSQVAVSANTLELLAQLKHAARIDTRARICLGPHVLTSALSFGGLDLSLEIIRRELGDKQAVQIAAELGCTTFSPYSEQLGVRLLSTVLE